MFCPNCGHDNLDTAAHCAACGTALVTGNAAPPPPSPPPPPPSQGYGQPQYGQQPAYGQHVAAQGPRPPNHMTWAIIATVVGSIANLLGCCCLPICIGTGIAAIIFANKVNTLFDNGDAAGANDASAKAKMWSMITTVFGSLFLLWFIISIVLRAMGVMEDPDWNQMLEQMRANQGG